MTALAVETRKCKVYSKLTRGACEQTRAEARQARGIDPPPQGRQWTERRSTSDLVILDHCLDCPGYDYQEIVS